MINKNKEWSIREEAIEDLNNICDECKKKDESVSHAEFQKQYFQFKYYLLVEHSFYSLQKKLIEMQLARKTKIQFQKI